MVKKVTEKMVTFLFARRLPVINAFWKMASGSLSDLSNTFLMILWAQLQLR